MKLYYTSHEVDSADHWETVEERIGRENKRMREIKQEKDLVSNLCSNNNWIHCKEISEILAVFPACPTYEALPYSLRIHSVKNWILEHHSQDVIEVVDAYGEHESLIITTGGIHTTGG